VAEKEIEPSEILRRTRVEVMPYLRELGRRKRALIPRIEISKRWVKYYEDLSKVRPLTEKEKLSLNRHRQTLEFLEARRNLYSKMAKYARWKSTENLMELRLAQARYYREKMDVLPPEEAEKLRDIVIPPPELYMEWIEVKQQIKAKCKRLKEAKRRVELPPVERYMRIRSLSRVLQDLYEQAYDVYKRGEHFPSIAGEWMELKRGGVE